MNSRQSVYQSRRDILKDAGNGSSAMTRPSWFQLFIAWLRLWLFRLVKLLIGVGYIVVIADGIRVVVPPLGTKLYSLPLLGTLKQYQGWHDLDLALFAAILLFALTSYLWCALLEFALYGNAAHVLSDRRPSNYQFCLTVLGGIILLSDACLFYRAMTYVGWGGPAFSPSALLCTLAYVAILVTLCVVSVNLKRDYLFLKRGRAPQGV